jgi:hypothetical protein
MQPLTRQGTRESLRSWWSDSNPNLRGPTMNIHTAAKPLIKFMYNWKALELVRNAKATPLVKTEMDIYAGYLLYLIFTHLEGDS